MRKTICAVALVVASIGIVAPAAYADTPGCVSRAEYRRVHHGMRQARVHRIFDTRGHRRTIASGGGIVSEVRGYRTCRRGGVVTVSYRNRRVSAKVALWRR